MMITTTMSMMNPVRLKLIICMLCLAMHLVCAEHQIMCIPRERQALLQFKAAVVDRYGMLSSWSNSSDCCQWHGIRCSNLTAHVLMLDLYDEEFFVSGKIHKSLTELRQLKYLNLSGNSFEDRAIPEFLGSLTNLRYLDLSSCGFRGEIPTQFGSLSHLKYLNLASNSLHGVIPPQLGNLSNLQHLDLSYNSIEGNIPSQLGNLFNLQYLDLMSNSIKGNIPSQLGNLSNLQHLDLSDNSIEGNIPSQLGNLSNLQHLDLSNNSIEGNIPSQLGNLSNLQLLDLSDNSIEGNIPSQLGNLSNLQNASTLRSLYLSNNSLSGDLPTIIHHLSRYAGYSLQELDMRMNQISGTLPNFLSTFPSLKRLSLGENKLNGTISEDVRFPAELEELDLSSNSLKGMITDFHFANMSKLNELMLSGNSLTLAFTPNWVPSFQLDYIELTSCKLGPTFPKWLQTQNAFSYLDISNAGISDTVPKWFWAKLAREEPYDYEIDISCNNLQGVIPNFPLKNHGSSALNLGSNQFEGPIPPFLRGYMTLDLSRNKFSECVSFLCDDGIVETLYHLDLSNNQLSGQIPDCWGHFKSLSYLNLSQNKFSGKIPTSMGSILELQVLLLRNNNLTDEVPSSLRNCTKLVMLDMAENRLSGPIPDWIGSELQELKVLSLGGNHFYGMQICYLKSIQLLDLSRNNLFGRIPKCIKNFASMTQKTFSRDYPPHILATVNYIRLENLKAVLMWKGLVQMFMNNELSLLKSIDLSSNHFSEEIPSEIEYLIELVSLNLSGNNLTGKIPSNIGKLTSLEFLDLSRNQLVGSIPWSLTQIDRLTMLDVSHNHLSGMIPTGTQLQSFNASSYEHNLDLCGPPLEKLCTDGEPTPEPIVKLHEDDNLLFTREFYMSMAIGFVTSFWGVFGSILMKRSWRHAYFKLLSNLTDKIYVMAALKIFKWRHRR